MAQTRARPIAQKTETQRVFCVGGISAPSTRALCSIFYTLPYALPPAIHPPHSLRPASTSHHRWRTATCRHTRPHTCQHTCQYACQHTCQCTGLHSQRCCVRAARRFVGQGRRLANSHGTACFLRWLLPHHCTHALCPYSHAQAMRSASLFDGPVPS